MNFKKDEILVLLGAGASKQAGIPTSVDMINDIESLLATEWREYKGLYNYIKSAIFYADGVVGRFDPSNYNIERLVNVLIELEKKEEHIIYPFIGNWNMKLTELAGVDFKKIGDFRKVIISKLQKWLSVDKYERAAYLQKLVGFKNEYNFPLRIFTLNYDLCIERNCVNAATVVRGFNDDREWDWKLFEDNPNCPVDIYLYKLHGSIDWTTDETESLTYVDDFGKIEAGRLRLIFGTNYKMQYIDPFLFFVYEFRRYSLESKIILTIGYGFGDEHINGIIAQALKADGGRKLLCVAPFRESVTEERRRDSIREILQINRSDQVSVERSGAKEFLESQISLERLRLLFPKTVDNAPF